MTPESAEAAQFERATTQRMRRTSSEQATILAVDDSPDSRALLEAMVRGADYNLLLAGSAEEAFALLGVGRPAARARPVDVILMDISMPRVDGLAAMRRIRTVDALRDVPIIVVTAHTEPSALEAAFAAGARDFVTKPVRVPELLARVRAAIELRAEANTRRAYARALLEMTQRLEEVNETLRRLSYLDWLTGVPNRMYFDTVIDSEWRRAHRDDEDISMLMIDIDFFHAFNERYGHPRGDECLKQVAAALRGTLTRPGDFLARYGGEEFAVVLPRTPEAGALVVAERLRARVEGLDLPHVASRIARRVTVSVGAATVAARRESTVADLLAAADRALYQAKSSGRNNVRVAPVRLRNDS